MNKNCAYTRKSLSKYLRGHLFKYEQVRIARHLNACPVCRSEFQALRKVADTKQLLKDITPPEGLTWRMKEGLFGLSKLKMLLYRPLWLAAIIVVGALVYINVIIPQRDIEIENIEKSLPPAAPVASAPTVTPVPASAAAQTLPVQATQPVESKQAAPAAAIEPLVITVTPWNEKTAIRRINEVIQEHGQLREMKFSDAVREISGNLTTKELLTFFNRIEQSGKVRYSRKRFESFPTAQPIPFVMKMNPAPKTVEHASPTAPPEYNPADAAAATGLPASAPTQSAR